MICGLALPQFKIQAGLCIKSCAIRTVYQIPVVALWYCWRTFTSGCLPHCKGAKQQNIRCIASSLKFLWHGSMEWNMEENFSMEWNMEWKIFGMEWKKIASMEYGKIVFHSNPYHALLVSVITFYLPSCLG